MNGPMTYFEHTMDEVRAVGRDLSPDLVRIAAGLYESDDGPDDVDTAIELAQLASLTEDL